MIFNRHGWAKHVFLHRDFEAKRTHPMFKNANESTRREFMALQKSIKEQMVVVPCLKRISMTKKMFEELNPSQVSVVKWFNAWIDNGWHHHKHFICMGRQQLYMHGDADSGKTTFINKLLLRGLEEEYIWMPDQSATSRGFFLLYLYFYFLFK
jgi:hypothetical protein